MLFVVLAHLIVCGKELVFIELVFTAIATAVLLTPALLLPLLLLLLDICGRLRTRQGKEYTTLLVAARHGRARTRARSVCGGEKERARKRAASPVQGMSSLPSPSCGALPGTPRRRA